MESYSLMDLLQTIIAGIAVPLTVLSIWQLVRKDKAKEKQIKDLSDIADAQHLLVQRMSEQIAELSKQTLQFEHQTVTLNESNELLREQVKIQGEAFMDDKKYKQQMIELEAKRHKEAMKPFFRCISTTVKENSINLILRNFGEKASQLSVMSNDSNISYYAQTNYGIIEKNQVIEIRCTVQNKHAIYSGAVQYEDIEGNRYNQTMKEFVINKIPVLEKPVEISNRLSGEISEAE